MNIAVIGAGFGGLSAAAVLAKAGHNVTIYEKTDQPGGRARVIKQDGFTFDAGPSWYLMPDVYEDFFAQFGKTPADYYSLQQLIPSYRAYFDDGPLTMRPAPAAYKDFDDVQANAGIGLGKLLAKTQKEYQAVRKQLLETDGLSLKQFVNPAALKMLLNPELELSYHGRIAKYVKEPRLQKILEFMTVFMGGSPRNIPALYSLLAWVDFGLGVWYPQGGFGSVVQGFALLARQQGVKIVYNSPVQRIEVVDGRASGVVIDGQLHAADAVLANADYHHVETQLLDAEWQSYSASYWEAKTISPSAVIGLIGVSKKLPLLHHSLFFDAPWDDNFRAVFDAKTLHSKPLFYVCTPSKTDTEVAPAGHENLFILIPVANTQASPAEYDALIDSAVDRIEQQIGVSFTADIVTKKVLARDYFADTFNAYSGNSFGLAHTRLQSGPLRPRIQSKKVSNLFFTGQYTNPGTGVPLVVLSGQVAARALMRYT